jgi:pSer/pThr/pTyr-binding forkhead associated (FHA) protein
VRRTILAKTSQATGSPAGTVQAKGSGATLGAPQGGREAVQPVSARRLVGVLAAPSLGSGGSIFAVREGKNTIGSDRTSDVCLSADPRVSLEHAVLLYRGGTFHLADRLSTNGTWVNGSEVQANGTVVLSDRDCIRCGGLELIFLIVEWATSSVADTPMN